MMSSLSRLLSIPFIILIILYFTVWQYQSAEADNWSLLPGLLILVLLYIFNREIDQWWWKKRPPALDPKIGAWLSTHSTYLQSLSDDITQRFVDRIATFMHIKDFTLKAEKDYHLPEEFKAIIAHEYIRLTIHQEQFLFNSYKNFVVYNHPFGTPNWQELHCVEVNHEDGVVVLSKLELVNGFDPSKPHFNVALYSAILAYLSLYPAHQKEDDPELSSAYIIQHLIGFEPPYMQAILGESVTPNNWALLVYVYMEKPAVLQQLHPILYKKIKAIIMDDRPNNH